MSDYSMSAYDLAVSMYEKSQPPGVPEDQRVPLHRRPAVIREAWVKAAQAAKSKTQH